MICSPFSVVTMSTMTNSKTNAIFFWMNGYVYPKNNVMGRTIMADTAMEPALPRAERRTASGPRPSISMRCPGRTVRAVSASGAPR